VGRQYFSYSVDNISAAVVDNIPATMWRQYSSYRVENISAALVDNILATVWRQYSRFGEDSTLTMGGDKIPGLL